MIKSLFEIILISKLSFYQAENRYRVPEDTRFYRVTVKPIIKSDLPTRKLMSSTPKRLPQQMSESQTTSSVASETCSVEPGPSSTPITPTRCRSNMETSISSQRELDISQKEMDTSQNLVESLQPENDR